MKILNSKVTIIKNTIYIKFNQETSNQRKHCFTLFFEFSFNSHLLSKYYKDQSSQTRLIYNLQKDCMQNRTQGLGEIQKMDWHKILQKLHNMKEGKLNINKISTH